MNGILNDILEGFMVITGSSFILKTWLNGISIYIYISVEISRGLQLTNYLVFLILEGYVS